MARERASASRAAWNGNSDPYRVTINETRPLIEDQGPFVCSSMVREHLSIHSGGVSMTGVKPRGQILKKEECTSPARKSAWRRKRPDRPGLQYQEETQGSFLGRPLSCDGGGNELPSHPLPHLHRSQHGSSWRLTTMHKPHDLRRGHSDHWLSEPGRNPKTR